MEEPTHEEINVNTILIHNDRVSKGRETRI